MSQYPPPQGPNYAGNYDPNNPPPYPPNYPFDGGYIPYATPTFAPNPRPTSVTVLAVIGIVLASLGLLGGVCIGLLPLVYSNLGPQLSGMFKNETLRTWMFISAAATVLFSVWLIVGAIASLNLKRWAWGAMIGYAIVRLAVDIGMFAVQYLYIQPLMDQSMRQFQGQMQNPTAQAVQQGCSAIVTFAYPIFVLIFYCRSNVRAAFGRAAV